MQTCSHSPLQCIPRRVDLKTLYIDCGTHEDEHGFLLMKIFQPQQEQARLAVNHAMKNIRDLTLKDCVLEHEKTALSLGSLVGFQMTQLKRLQVIGPCGHITGPFFSALSASNGGRNLAELSVNMSGDYASAGFNAIGKLINLQVLRVDASMVCKSSDLFNILAPLASLNLRRLRHLMVKATELPALRRLEVEYLDFECIYHNQEGASHSGAAFEHFFAEHPNLVVSFPHARMVTDPAAFVTFCFSAPTLGKGFSTLHLDSEDGDWSPARSRELVATCPNLKCLKVRDLGDSGGLAYCLPHLDVAVNGLRALERLELTVQDKAVLLPEFGSQLLSLYSSVAQDVHRTHPLVLKVQIDCYNSGDDDFIDGESVSACVEALEDSWRSTYAAQESLPHADIRLQFDRI